MPSLLFVLFLGITAAFVEAQDQPKAPANAEQQQPRQQPQLDKDAAPRDEQQESASERDAGRGATR